MKTIRTLALLTFAISASALASGCIIVSDDDDSDGSFTLDNRSSIFFDTIELGLSPDGAYLVEAVDVAPGDIVTIFVPCDFYDVRLTNEFGGQCEIFDLDLCFSDEVWVMTDSDICTFADGRKLDLKSFATEKPTQTQSQP